MTALRKWPPRLSAPIFAGDNHRMAVNQSKQTVGRPPARPQRKEAPNYYDPCPPEDEEMVASYADRRGF